MQENNEYSEKEMGEESLFWEEEEEEEEKEEEEEEEEIIFWLCRCVRSDSRLSGLRVLCEQWPKGG